MAAVNACRSCGAPIEWAITAKGKRMPLDVEPDSAGLFVVVDGHARNAVEHPERTERRTSHFATCPNASTHRKPTQATTGHLYDLGLVETSFRATGLDAAHRVARRLNAVLRAALEADPEALSIETGPYFQEASSPANFAPKSSTPTRETVA